MSTTHKQSMARDRQPASNYRRRRLCTSSGGGGARCVLCTAWRLPANERVINSVALWGRPLALPNPFDSNGDGDGDENEMMIGATTSAREFDGSQFVAT